jgi:LacI family transcriptional regulator
LDGLIVIGAYSELLFYLKKTDLPFILVDSYLQDDTVYSVGIDDRYGGYIATKYLLESGHRRIGLLTGELLDNGVYMERFKGYRRALEEKGLRVDDKNIYETETSFRGGYEGVDKLLDQNNSLTGIFSTADIISVGVLKKLKEMEVSVPDDLSLISFDDNPFAEFLYPALTTINQSIIIKGSCAAKLLMDVINNKEIDEKKLNYRLS